MSKILFLDTETGSIDPEVGSVLQLAFVIYDPADPENTDNSFVVGLKWPTYHVQAKALEINRINLVEHHASAICVDQFIMDFLKWICKHLGDEKITLGGHNTHFDMKQLMFVLNYAGEGSEAKELRKRFLHRMVDTYPIAHFLHEAGKLQITEFGYNGAIDLPTLTKALGITLEGTAEHHTALGDILATIKAYRGMLQLL